MIFNKSNIVLILLLAGLVLVGCEAGTDNKTKESADKKALNVVVTTGMIKDLVTNIAKDKVEVTALMGAGVDPHYYKATQGDLKAIQNADIVFHNGLFLEGKMESILEKLAEKKPVFPVTAYLDKSNLLNFSFDDVNTVYDPHVWMDISMWEQTVDVVASKLVAQDAGNKDFYEQNAAAYKKELSELHSWAKTEIAALQEQKLLITSHDAFGYFGRAYGLEVDALQGISTVTEFGLKDITNLVDKLTERKVKALFVESSVTPKPLEAVVEGCSKKGHEVAMGGTLYADAMGAEGTPEGTYIGMMKHNVSTIVSGLK